jgi:hypothetical protein
MDIIKVSENYSRHCDMCPEGMTLCIACFNSASIGEKLCTIPIEETYSYYTNDYCSYHYEQYVY